MGWGGLEWDVGEERRSSNVRTSVFLASVQLHHQDSADEGAPDAEAEEDLVEVDEFRDALADADGGEETAAEDDEGAAAG
jgi:hypothetical protein